MEKHTLFCSSSPYFLLSFTLCLFSGALLGPFLRSGDAGNNVIKGVINNPDGFDFWWTTPSKEDEEQEWK